MSEYLRDLRERRLIRRMLPAQATRLQLLWLAVVGLLAVGPVVAAAIAWQGGTDSHRTLVRSNQPDSGVYLEATIVAVDPTSGLVTAQVRPNLTNGPSEIDLLTNDAIGERTRRLSAGNSATIIMTSALEGGSVSRFPFDSYEVGFSFAVKDTAGNLLPVVASFDSNVNGHRFNVEEATTDAGLIAGYQIRVTRSWTTLVYALGVMAIMWGLAIAAMAVSWTVVVGRVEPDMWVYGFFVGVLFALPPLRDSVPGRPPAGTLLDFVAFYWSIAAIATGLLLLLFTWLRRVRATITYGADPSDPTSDL